MAETDLKTLPELAKAFGVSTRRADYAAKAYDVAPTSTVAGIRLFNPDAAQQLRRAILPRRLQPRGGGPMNTTSDTVTKLLLTRREAAKALSISERSLYTFSAPRGDIPTVTIGSSIRYRPADLAAWAEAQAMASTKGADK